MSVVVSLFCSFSVVNWGLHGFEPQAFHARRWMMLHSLGCLGREALVASQLVAQAFRTASCAFDTSLVTGER